MPNGDEEYWEKEAEKAVKLTNATDDTIYVREFGNRLYKFLWDGGNI